nr:lytic polysaccharide monooxygenase [Pantoea sp. BAV 3049]
MPLMTVSNLSEAQESSLRHGFVSVPPSRAYLCSAQGGNLNKNCGSIQYEPQSLEGPKGFPASGPEDGKIASAGHDNYAALDEQTATRWHHSNLSTGDNTFTWTLTAPHKTDKWRFFITKKDWNPNEKLTRDQFDLNKPLCEQNDEGKVPERTVTIKGCTIPSDYTGYHVILGI